MVGETMELKDMILSTLAELDASTAKDEKPIVEQELANEHTARAVEQEPLVDQGSDEDLEPVVSDLQFYKNLRERILVLFEGFQSPNNKNIEAKLDLTLNFLEYLLATIEEQIEKTR